MKKFIFFSAIALLAFATVGCNKEEEIILEIALNSNKTVIDKEINGIVFKFCLLNKDGQSSTVFNEGENFSLCFSIKNLLKDNIKFKTDFINSNFYRIYNNKHIDMGKPWTGIWCEFKISPQNIHLSPNNIKEFKCPWKLTTKNQPDYPLCMGQSKEDIPKGDYYTIIKTDFNYIINGKKQSIKNINFKINFKIE